MSVEQLLDFAEERLAGIAQRFDAAQKLRRHRLRWFLWGYFCGAGVCIAVIALWALRSGHGG